MAWGRAAPRGWVSIHGEVHLGVHPRTWPQGRVDRSHQEAWAWGGEAASWEGSPGGPWTPWTKAGVSWRESGAPRLEMLTGVGGWASASPRALGRGELGRHWQSARAMREGQAAHWGLLGELQSAGWLAHWGAHRSRRVGPCHPWPCGSSWACGWEGPGRAPWTARLSMGGLKRRVGPHRGLQPRDEVGGRGNGNPLAREALPALHPLKWGDPREGGVAQRQGLPLGPLVSGWRSVGQAEGRGGRQAIRGVAGPR